MFLRWLRTEAPMLITVLFCLFSWSLLFGVRQMNARLREANDARVVADSHRRSGLIADFAEERRRIAAQLAAMPEVEHFLTNRALGMSMKYGLGVSLDAVEKAFRDLLTRPTLGGVPVYQRIVFLDGDGTVRIDVGGEQGLLPPPPSASQTDAVVEFDLTHGRIVAIGPVWHRDRHAGSVVTVSAISLLERFLTPVTADVHFRELLVHHGTEVPLADRAASLSAAEARRLSEIPFDRVYAASSR